MEKRYIRVLRRGLLLVNGLENYPQERALLIASISSMKAAYSQYLDRKLSDRLLRETIDMTNSLITNTEQATLGEEVNQLDSFLTLLESDEVESLTGLFGQESVDVLWSALMKDAPKGVKHDQSFYASIS